MSDSGVGVVKKADPLDVTARYVSEKPEASAKLLSSALRGAGSLRRVSRARIKRSRWSSG